MPRGKPRQFTFDGRPHILTRYEKVGDCEQPGDELPYVIWVSPRERGKSELDTFIHEAMHAAHPGWTEDEVAMRAHNLTEFLWHAGYRMKRGKND